jgi:hypothetical protein
MRRLFGMLAALMILVTACEPMGLLDVVVPPENVLPEIDELTGVARTEQELTFARLASGVEAEVQQASFFAVQGQARSLVVRYQGQDPSEPPLLEFQVGAESLLTLPNGLPVLPGDSVQITVTLDPQRRFIFHFAPHGLTFSTSNPARLRVNWSGADPDVNGDGVVTLEDEVRLHQFRLWQRDAPELPWVRLPTKKHLDIKLLDGRVIHFTGFAMAD